VSALSDYLNAHMPDDWSKRDLIRALRDDIDRTTVYRYLAGTHSPNPGESVLQAFARVLPGATMVELRAAAGQAAGAEEPWVLPPEAQRLSRAQRAAIELIIRGLVNAPEPPPADAPPPADVDAEQVRAYAQRLRSAGQDELAGRFEDALANTSSASDTANKSSRT
jgi:hypothetical protein